MNFRVLWFVGLNFYSHGRRRQNFLPSLLASPSSYTSVIRHSMEPQPQQTNNTNETHTNKTNETQHKETNETQKHLGAQNLLSEARRKLKLEHTEATRSVVDPTAEKPPRLTARQRARYPKLTPTYDILSEIPKHDTLTKDAFKSLTSSQQYLLQLDPPSVEPFYAQLEEIDRIRAQFKLLARKSHAQVNSQARR